MNESVAQPKTMLEDFEKNGFYVLRGVLTDDEVDQLARPIRAAFTAGDYDTVRRGDAYPAPGIHSMGPRVLEHSPEIADCSFAHPKIVAAIESLFGEPATLAQYWSIMRPPGAGVDKGEPFVPGSGAHYDYKPWRCVGSYVKWMFAVIPFVDYTETVGPLAIAPGSHLKSTLQPSDGRVHQMDAACVPKPSEILMVDPDLKKGDVVLMHGFAWHEARPNYGNSDRCGLYMKFHAKSSPPACGPTIYPTAVHEHLREDVKHLVPYHRDDGQFAAVRETPVGGVDEGRVVIEDADDRVLLLGSDADGWNVPRFDAHEDATASILDVCNVMGSVVTQAHERLGIRLPWLSWLTDLSAHEDDGAWRCRVYGHRLPGGSVSVADGVAHRWVTSDELAALTDEGRVRDGEEVCAWLHMWQNEVDEDGNAVTRSYGVPTTDVQYYVYNRTGEQQGTYRVGQFDDEGMPLPAAF